MAPATAWEPSKKQASPRKKRRRVRIAIIAALLAVYAGGTYYFSSHMTPGTTVDGVSAGMLTKDEEKSLSLGAMAMTTECGVRFLTDYLNGDKYFRVHYADQNLARAKCHLTLARDIRDKLTKMQEIVDKYL
jgi:hypothetical protein